MREYTLGKILGSLLSEPSSTVCNLFLSLFPVPSPLIILPASMGRARNATQIFCSVYRGITRNLGAKCVWVRRANNSYRPTRERNYRAINSLLLVLLDEAAQGGSPD